jgi:hypothetical protein
LTSTRGRSRFAGEALVPVVVAAGFLASVPALAFVYSEHRSIAGDAIAGITPQHAATLARLWALAREGYDVRLCAEPWTGPRGLDLDCVDFAAWSAIGGDHSCSPAKLLDAVLEGELILRMNAIAADEAEALAAATRDDQRRNAATSAQIALARADPEYAARAGANNAHFLMPRQGQDSLAYLDAALDRSAEPNSAATYFFFHGAAMILAARSDPYATGPEASARARRILALEAFAEHFLEDMFASGHVAGSWGNVAERKGTHDFYNRQGLEVRSWDGNEKVLFGDAFLKPDGLDRAAEAVRVSLDQVLDAWTPTSAVRIAVRDAPSPEEALSGTYDVCASKSAPDWDVAASLEPWFVAVSMRMPIPFRGAGPGSLPRVHAEIGPFLGLVAGGSLAGSGGSYDGIDTGGQLIDSLSLGLRVGLGLEELLTDSADGLIFLQGGVSMSSAEATDCPECTGGRDKILPRIPARSGISVAFRAPFWLVPGDLILAVPFLLLTAPDKFTNMASVAATGGLVPWQRRFHTPVGTFQFVLGREADATFYGFTGGLDEFVTLDPERDDLVVVGYRSVVVEIPVLEYQVFRSYGSRQALDLRFQFGGGFDKPLEARAIDPPGATAPSLQTRYFGYVRLVFEGRRYL